MGGREKAKKSWKGHLKKRLEGLRYYSTREKSNLAPCCLKRVERATEKREKSPGGGSVSKRGLKGAQRGTLAKKKKEQGDLEREWCKIRRGGKLTLITFSSPVLPRKQEEKEGMKRIPRSPKGGKGRPYYLKIGGHISGKVKEPHIWVEKQKRENHSRTPTALKKKVGRGLVRREEKDNRTATREEENLRPKRPPPPRQKTKGISSRPLNEGIRPGILGGDFHLLLDSISWGKGRPTLPLA